MGENIIAQAAPILESPVGPKFRIGLSVENPEESSSEDGLLVNQVMEDSPAAQAGIEEGDIIIAINGEQAKDFKALQETVQEAGSQQRAVKLKLNRDGKEITLKVQPTKSEEASAMNFKFVPQAGSILPLDMMPGQAGGVFQIAGPSQLGQQELTETKEQIAELKEEIQELKAMVKKLLDSTDKR
jgi:C-terminal processing protease CtpA/Prc